MWKRLVSRVAQEVVRVLLSAKAQISPDTGDGPQELQDAIDGCHVEVLQQKWSEAFCFLLNLLRSVKQAMLSECAAALAWASAQGARNEHNQTKQKRTEQNGFHTQTHIDR